jgi:hypothetical protein
MHSLYLHFQEYLNFLTKLKFEKAYVDMFAVCGENSLRRPRDLSAPEVGVLSFEA